MLGSVEERLAALVVSVENLRAEVARLRDRWHDEETVRATVVILKRVVDELDADMPNLARQAAREAVDEYLARHRANTLANWRTYAALISAGVALGALIVGLVLR